MGWSISTILPTGSSFLPGLSRRRALHRQTPEFRQGLPNRRRPQRGPRLRGKRQPARRVRDQRRQPQRARERSRTVRGEGQKLEVGQGSEGRFNREFVIYEKAQDQLRQGKAAAVLFAPYRKDSAGDHHL